MDWLYGLVIVYLFCIYTQIAGTCTSGENLFSLLLIIDPIVCESVGGSASTALLPHAHHLPEPSRQPHYNLQSISHSPLQLGRSEPHSMPSMLPAIVYISISDTSHQSVNKSASWTQFICMTNLWYGLQ